jgi:LCP family protein required for cell wall assembly
MARTARSPRHPSRSAFAAAFLSFILPGLGQAYLRRWVRAAAWLFLPLVSLAVGASLVAGPDRTAVLTRLADPDILLGAIGLVVLDLLYRLCSMIDAWYLGRDPLVGSATTRTASALGLVILAVVLVASHGAIAQPIVYAQGLLGTLDGAGGDDTAIPDLEELPDEFAHLRSGQEPDPDASPGQEPAPTAGTEPTPRPWTDTERLDILLVGLDSGRRGSSTFLTDTMMVVSVDPRSGRLAFISLPRDTVGVPLPAAWSAARAVYGTRFAGRINTLYTTARIQSKLFPGSDRQRGYKALMGALSELYGLDIRYYVAVDLSGFRGGVNALGGLIVDVRQPLLDPGYPTDDGRGKLKLYVPPGMQPMNGQQALAYARSRKSTSDFDRAERQQLLVLAARAQLDLGTLLGPGVIGALFKEFQQHVSTNIPARMVPSLASLASRVDLGSRRSLVLSPQNGFSTENDSYELIPNLARIEKAVQRILDRPRRQGPTDP